MTPADTPTSPSNGPGADDPIGRLEAAFDRLDGALTRIEKATDGIGEKLRNAAAPGPDQADLIRALEQTQADNAALSKRHDVVARRIDGLIEDVESALSALPADERDTGT